MLLDRITPPIIGKVLQSQNIHSYMASNLFSIFKIAKFLPQAAREFVGSDSSKDKDSGLIDQEIFQNVTAQCLVKVTSNVIVSID